jgi:cytochrome c peroxidase
MSLLATAVLLLVSTVGHESTRVVLRTDCPPSFEKTADGTCRFVSLYDFYAGDPGQGGLRVRLLKPYDGFTPAQADLGRYLFFDPILSQDHSLSCAHCHNPAFGYADGRATSSGRGGSGVGPARAGGKRLARSAPSLWNVGFLDRLFWDGRASSLQEQAQGPLFAPDEMANTAETLVRDLSGIATYRRLFAMAYGRPADSAITVREVVDALAAFEASLISLNSRYDHYAQGDSNALSPQEIRGFNVFRGFVARCSQCHVPPLFASSDLAVVGAPAISGQKYDLGAGEGRPETALRGAFKIPTLRNITCTGPYFQAGQFEHLEDVVRFYNDRRGHAAPAKPELHINWNVHMTKPELTEADVADLVAFLGALTDESSSPPIPVTVPSGLPVAHAQSQQCKG